MVEIGNSKPRKIDFTSEGKQLFVRQMPLRLGLKIQQVNEDEAVSPEIIAEIVSQCVVDKSGKSIWSVDDVLGFDLQPMLQIFSEVSGAKLEDAEKN